MFSALLRKAMRGTRLGYFAVFGATFLLLLCFGGATFFLLRAEAKRYCRNDVRSRLEKYLEQQSSSPGFFSRNALTEKGLYGLDFIRVSSAEEQLFLTGTGELGLDFQDIVNLAPDLNATLLPLPGKEAMGYWSIYSQPVGAGTVQAGRKHTEVAVFLKRFETAMLFMLGPALLLAAGVAFFSRWKSRNLLMQAQRSLEDIAAGRSRELLPVQDNTELADLYQPLNKLISQNNQLIQEMQESLDNVAHDLRTPMTRLRSVAEYGLRKNTPEKLGEALSDCLEEAERVLSMLGIMMSVAEAESGTMRLDIEELDLQATLSDAVNLYEYVAEEKQIELHMDVDKDIVVKADRIRIRQVWANLIDNAIKYSSTGGSVNISASRSATDVRVYFKDNGMGISVAERERIWERLFRGDRSRSQQGLGLGLNYVRAVVEAHGGTVQVQSRLGEGSCFEVRLPA